MEPYHLAQRAMADLKAAVYAILKENQSGLRNVDIGKELGIYTGHEKHGGHILRILLALMEAEGLVVQRADKAWRIKEIGKINT